MHTKLQEQKKFRGPGGGVFSVLVCSYCLLFLFCFAPQNIAKSSSVRSTWTKLHRVISESELHRAKLHRAKLHRAKLRTRRAKCTEPSVKSQAHRAKSHRANTEPSHTESNPQRQVHRVKCTEPSA